MNSKEKRNLIKSIASACFALFVGAGVVAFTLQAVAVFELEMLPKLIIPIIFVSIPFYIFFKKTLFKN